MVFACFGRQAQPHEAQDVLAEQHDGGALQQSLLKVASLEKELAQAQATIELLKEQKSKNDAQAAGAAAELRMRQSLWAQREQVLCNQVAQLQRALEEARSPQVQLNRGSRGLSAGMVSGQVTPVDRASSGAHRALISAASCDQQDDDLTVFPVSTLTTSRDASNRTSHGGATVLLASSACTSVLPSGASATSQSSASCASQQPQQNQSRQLGAGIAAMASGALDQQDSQLTMTVAVPPGAASGDSDCCCITQEVGAVTSDAESGRCGDLGRGDSGRSTVSAASETLAVPSAASMQREAAHIANTITFLSASTSLSRVAAADAVAPVPPPALRPSLLRASDPEYERPAASQEEARRTAAALFWRMGDDNKEAQHQALVDLRVFMAANPHMDVLNKMIRHISPGFRHMIVSGLNKVAEEEELLGAARAAAAAGNGTTAVNDAVGAVAVY